MGASEDELIWSKRLPKLKRKIASVGADIVCLQEVSRGSFSEDFGSYFQKEHGYDWRLNNNLPFKIVNEENAKMDFTTAIMYNSSKFECVYEDYRSRATILLLTNKVEQSQCKYCAHSKRICLYHSMFVVNVHLQSPYGGSHTISQRVNGLKSALKRINFCVSEKLKLNANAETANIRVLIVGDFNSSVDCPGSRMLLNTNDDFKKHQYRFEEAYRQKMLSETLDVLDPNIRTKHFPTYIVQSTLCIDLLFYTADTLTLRGVGNVMDEDTESAIKWKEKCAQRIDQWLERGKRTDKNEESELADFSDIWPCPNHQMPSDHLPICGVFEFENLCHVNNGNNEQCRCCVEPVVKKKLSKKERKEQRKRNKKQKGGVKTGWQFHEIRSF